MNEERIRELQDFADEFHQKLEDSHKRWEQVMVILTIDSLG
jgi:hypothetical protein